MLIFVVISPIYTTDILCCFFLPYLEQKARATYEKLTDLCKDDPDVIDVLRFLRERETVHFQRFGEALNGVQDKLAEKRWYTGMRNTTVNGINTVNNLNNKNTNNRNGSCGCNY